MPLFKRTKTSADLIEPTPAGSEGRIQQVGEQLLETARRHPDAKGLKDKLADWAMKDDAFKVQLFRFVDAFPMLSDADAVHRHLVEYLGEAPAPGMSQPTLPAGMGLGLKAGGLMKGTMSKTIAAQITAMAKRFIVGTDAESAVPLLRQRWNEGVAFSVDLLGEACLSEQEAATYCHRYNDLINNLAREVKDWPAKPLLESDHLGPVPRANVSIKVSSLVAKFEPIDFEGSLERCYEAIAPLLKSAAEHGVLINFDVEQSALKELNLALFMRCCETIDFEAGLAMQAYLKTGDDDAQRVIDWTKKTGRQVTVRLVKGAYWDYEVIHAQEQGWPCPVWTTKRESDAYFERMAKGFDSILISAGIKPVKTPVMAPNANAFVESLVASIKRECLNHFVCFGRSHLDHLLDAYTRFYNEDRPHQGIGNRTLSFGREAEDSAELSRHAPIGRIGYQSELGGLLKHYYRKAA